MHRFERRSVLSLLLPLLLTGCPFSPQAPSEAPADARGTVTQKPPVLQEYAFLMEELPEADTGGKYYVRVTPRTRILLDHGTEGVREGDLDDVTPGAIVEVWFSGPVMESYPAQATAATILVVGYSPQG